MLSRRTLSLGLGIAILTLAGVVGGTYPVAISANGTWSGEPVAGVPCADGGEGRDGWDHLAEVPLPSGRFSALPGDLTVSAGIRHEDGPGAWLASESAVTLANARGSLRLALSAGACGDEALAYDGAHASGAGTWVVVPQTTGPYREATGSGTFALSAEVGPGEFPFSLDLDGDVAVWPPTLSMEVERAVWERATPGGVRHALVTYRIVNTGPGDAFGVRVLDASTAADGVTTDATLPAELGDVPAGAGATFDVRYAFERGRGCDPPGRCGFVADLVVLMPDALDEGEPLPRSVDVRVPMAPQRS